MKPASVIFLIVSIVIIIAGLLLCTFGINSAREQNIALFDNNIVVDGENTIRTDIFDSTNVNRIKVRLDEADIIVMPTTGADSYIELVNFQVGTYDYSVQNKILLIDNETSIFSLLKIADGNFNFNGLRQYLTFRKNNSTKKTLRIFLSETDATVKSFEIECKSGSVILSGLSLAADYTVSTGTGDVYFDSVSTKSGVTISVTTGDVILDNLKCKTCNVTLDTGTLDSNIRSVTKEWNATVGRGNIYMNQISDSTYGIYYTLSAPRGHVIFNGTESSEDPFTMDGGIGTVAYRLTAENGSITAKLGTETTTLAHDIEAYLSEARQSEEALVGEAAETEAVTTDTAVTDAQ